MREELDYRRITLRPRLLEEVKTARGFGGLSENFEYKAFFCFSALRDRAHGAGAGAEF